MTRRIGSFTETNGELQHKAMFSLNLFVFLQMQTQVFILLIGLHTDKMKAHIWSKRWLSEYKRNFVIQSMHGDKLNKYFMTGVHSLVRILSLLCMHT